MSMTADDMTTDADRWGYRVGSRFVGPQEWLSGLPSTVQHVLHLDVLTQGLAAAADMDGLLLDYRPNAFYTGPLSDVLRDEHDASGWQLQYDRFAAMTLLDARHQLLEAGLLATRGNGDSVDYRLALPTNGA